MPELLLPEEVDEVLRLKPGTAKRKARRGDFPHVTLPTGDVRFRRRDIEQMTGLSLEDSETREVQLAH